MSADPFYLTLYFFDRQQRQPATTTPAHRYRTAVKSPEDLPVDACEQLVGVMLDLLDLLQKGEPTPRRHKTIADHMNEAYKMQVRSSSLFLACFFLLTLCPLLRTTSSHLSF